MAAIHTSRRSLLAAASLLPAFQLSAEDKNATPSEVLGPFYKKGAPNAKRLRAAQGPGMPLAVKGSVFNTKGDKLPEATVELWHADHAGVYDTQGFNFRAKLRPNEQGVYEVETIMPGSYVDRPAQHIHYLISAPGHKTLVTQAYFSTDPFFEGDPVKNYKKRGIVRHADLVRPVTLHPDNSAAIQFDIILERL
jgi:catechol 1,2-dioxygenase